MATFYKTKNPTELDNVAAGYAIGDIWKNLITYSAYQQESDGVWIWYQESSVNLSIPNEGYKTFNPSEGSKIDVYLTSEQLISENPDHDSVYFVREDSSWWYWDFTADEWTTKITTGGSPAGVYATSAELISANPDHSYIYLVQSDGNWWYWNQSESQWKAGGQYQTALSIVQTFGTSTTSVISQDKITTSLSNQERAASDAITSLESRIKAMEDFFNSGTYENIQVNNLSVVNSIKFNGSDIFLSGLTAPSISPDFIGQFYINIHPTTGGTTYQAKGISSSADWKITSN